ncbi:hypothetical protein PPERSA_06791 [Pseudocohnilembus persalinus]|uniref:Uncharacterized protein n=1 Tax=Pseudocohnilembus persalinus TaxID=266149 RepID=A0A0V0QT89_PSEPJ|nr:hypothetical protein PPERSA_06791 [Pseudocohnilembus persalinus]|eukprot:KRX05157.1 hypothetical protein PPERSA_06791 [Pseudocohnilembus persalinus]
MFQYNLFQQVPQEIVQQCQAIKDSPLNQSLFQKIYWLISLKEFPQTALSFLHFSKKLSENIFSEQQLIDELKYIQNFALPKNSIISGYIVLQEELNSELQAQTIQFRKNLLKIQQQYKDLFSNDLINIFINEDFKFTSKDWRENKDVDLTFKILRRI